MSTYEKAPLWSSHLAFYLGAVGGAVGLGSIWRFPYLAGTSGGSAFVFVFVLCCGFIAVPLLAAEFLIGRRARCSPPQAAGVVAQESGRSSRWSWIGGLGTFATFLIMSYYCVIAGWVLAYTWKVGVGQLTGLDRQRVASLWHEFLGNPLEVGAWHLVFVGTVALISARGLKGGIEAANLVRAPAMLVLLLVLAAYALVAGDAVRGLSFAFSPNFSAITPQIALAAVGQAFFATGVGMAMMLAFGAYVRPGTSLVRCALLIVGAIVAVSMLAAVIVFPLVFAYDLNPAAGTELVFQVLPNAFAEMPGGRLIGTLFFLLLVFAALTPSLAGIEPLVAWLMQKRGYRRSTASFLAAGSCWIVGIGSVLSFNVLERWNPFGSMPVLGGMTFFGVTDFVSSNILLVSGAFLTSVFVGWRVRRSVIEEELGETSPTGRRVIVWLLRYVCPLAILAVTVAGLIGSRS